MHSMPYISVGDVKDERTKRHPPFGKHLDGDGNKFGGDKMTATITLRKIHIYWLLFIQKEMNIEVFRIRLSRCLGALNSFTTTGHEFFLSFFFFVVVVAWDIL